MDLNGTVKVSAKSRHVVAAVLIYCLAHVAIPTEAYASSVNRGSGRSELRALTKVAGRKTASMTVHLSRRVLISAPKGHRMSDDITISGGGRYAGIVLVSNDWRGGLLHEDLLIINRWGLCEDAGCPPGPDVINQFRGLERDEEGRAILKAGEYTLHILADGAPVEVTLRLPGAPSGTARLRPTGPSSVDFEAPGTSVEQEIGGTYTYGAGSDFQAGAVGVSSSLLYAAADQDLDGFSGGICHIDSPSGPPESAYGPQCYALTAAGMGKGFYLINEDIEDREFALLPLISYHDQGIQPPNIDGKRGLGAWVSTSYPLTEFRFMGFFVQAP